MTSSAAQEILDWRTDRNYFSGDSYGSAEILRSFKDGLQTAIRSRSSGETGAFQGNSVRKLVTSLDRTEFKIDVVTPKIWRKARNVHTISARSSFSPSQEWEGYVIEVSQDTFTANLSRVDDPSGLVTDQAQFELRALPQSDQQRIELGSIVRWVIGFERLPSDQRQRVSRVHLRRLPVFTKTDLQRALLEADELLSGLRTDETT